MASQTTSKKNTKNEEQHEAQTKRRPREMERKKVYDITTLPGDKPALQQIEVLEEGTYAGATVPTMRVRYPDGTTARCALDMYQPTPAAAIEKALAVIAQSLLYLQEEKAKIRDEMARLKAMDHDIRQLAGNHKKATSKP
jgi:hypothetical protein